MDEPLPKQPVSPPSIEYGRPTPDHSARRSIYPVGRAAAFIGSILAVLCSLTLADATFFQLKSAYRNPTEEGGRSGDGCHLYCSRCPGCHLRLALDGIRSVRHPAAATCRLKRKERAAAILASVICVVGAVLLAAYLGAGLSSQSLIQGGRERSYNNNMVSNSFPRVLGPRLLLTMPTVRLAIAFSLAGICRSTEGPVFAGSPAMPATQPAVEFARSIPLPGVAGPVDRNGIAGRLDHLAYDAATHRLFLAAFSKGSLEVIDLDSGKLIQSVGGIPEAQGVAIAPALGRVFVTSGDDGHLRAFDVRTLEPRGSVMAIEDADNCRFDAGRNQVLVGGGSKDGGAVLAFDPATLAKVGEMPIPSHAESFQLAPDGKIVAINVPGDKYAEKEGVVVIADREKGATLATWRVDGAARNFPMAVDSESGGVFAISRKPARVTWFEKGGRVVATAACIADSDDAFFDGKTKRLFVIGGGRRTMDRAGEKVAVDQPGALDIFDIRSTSLQKVASIPLPPHARTGLFVPERRAIYIAVPVQGGKPAEIEEFSVGDAER